MPGTVEQILTVDQLPRLRQMLDFALRTKETHSQAGQEIASTELHMLLDQVLMHSLLTSVLQSAESTLVIFWESGTRKLVELHPC